MTIDIHILKSTDDEKWDKYVYAHPRSTLYHLSGWKNVIQNAYGHNTYYLMAINKSGPRTVASNPVNPTNSYIVGILPLVHLKNIFFGNSLISIPFFDVCGLLTDDEETEKVLVNEAIKIGIRLKAKYIELRHFEPRQWLDNVDLVPDSCSEVAHMRCVTRSHKVRMLLDLPETPQLLMNSFKSKLRSQIKKPMKENLIAKTGGEELLKDFYEVFTKNMRDLGSPVHSLKLIRGVFEEFPENTRIVMVYKETVPLACSLIVGFKDILENPWASSLREYSSLNPNMLLYWKMLEYGCDNDYDYFDFGRSSPDEGTYRFKAQWGAKPNMLYWNYIATNGSNLTDEVRENSAMELAGRLWKKLPVPVTRVLGPGIRKNIGL